MSHKEHRENAPRKLNYFVITISSSRYEKVVKKEPVIDESGDIIKQMVIESGNAVVGYEIVPDNKWKILKAVVDPVERDDVDVIITSGGTGYTPDDVTVDTILRIVDKEVVGFGDIFRHLSFSDPDVKSAAYLTRTSAGVIGNKAIFMLPGSPDAVKLAMRELIIPEAPHLVYLIRRR
ncbi:molybdenum cofactor biosynthesis protein [Sulfolobales archaeon HS-7]|nr:molybdenum cofactor biosynthesis protein [Sulfolobales archaeon HS-7]